MSTPRLSAPVWAPQQQNGSKLGRDEDREQVGRAKDADSAEGEEGEALGAGLGTPVGRSSGQTSAQTDTGTGLENTALAGPSLSADAWAQLKAAAERVTDAQLEAAKTRHLGPPPPRG